MNELDFSFDLNIDDFSDISFDLGDTINSRYIKPPKTNKSEKFVKLKKATEFVDTFDLEKDCRIHAIVDGQFVFMDLLLEIVIKQKLAIKKLSISTLSLSFDNIETLQALLESGYVDQLDIVVSDYFYSHERHSLIKNMYHYLDIDDRFQLAVASTHTKIMTFETENGEFYTIHGSANLRSSSNLEQICIEESKDLYYFYTQIHDSIIEKYYTIDKSLRRKSLWQAVQNDSKNTTKQ